MPIKTVQDDVTNEGSCTRGSVGFSIKTQIASLTSFGNIERVPANLGDIGTNPIDVLLKSNVQSRAASPFDSVRYISVAFLWGFIIPDLAFNLDMRQQRDKKAVEASSKKRGARNSVFSG